MNRRVALKLPRIVWGDSFAERLAREREILATLEHEHIARLYDAGIDAHGRPFLAMEYVDREEIDVYCSTHDLSVRERVALLLQVMAAVGHAHSRPLAQRRCGFGHRHFLRARVRRCTAGLVADLDRLASLGLCDPA